jgi:flagellar basal body rod protein FlgF
MKARSMRRTLSTILLGILVGAPALALGEAAATTGTPGVEKRIEVRTPGLMPRLTEIQRSLGNATIGSANAGGRGVVIFNSVELSNVDITQEFTDLIISQRGYQASSRIITTTDEVIQEALSLKR